MKAFYTYLFLTIFTLLGFTATSSVYAAVTPDSPTNFITTWNTENDGSSASDQITIPGTGGGYSYEIYWEDTASSTINGTTTLITTDSHTLTFPAPGIYEVQASGTFPRIYFNDGGDKDKILTVEQWGDIAWVSMERAFFGASNLRVPATDAPDLSGVTSMAFMFNDATSFNDPINHWDVSTVESLSATFGGATDFNQPLNNWNTTSLTNMINIFNNTSSFNQDISDWDVSQVTNMLNVFVQATDFNQPLNDWDVSSVISFGNMFWDASSFNQPLNNWDTASATLMFRVFSGATSFNQPLNDWDTSGVTDMYQMFTEATSFNQPLNDWDTSGVTDMYQMFDGATVFNQDVSSWDVSAVRFMGLMFQNTTLSQQNQNATLQAWSQQSLQDDVVFNIGLKNYSDTGAAAIQTLRGTYNWTIEEQYSAEYYTHPRAALIGTSYQAPLNNNATTTEIEIRPDTNCEFTQWSDGNTSNPRQDALTDNLSVTAEVYCPPSGSTGSARSTRSNDTDITTDSTSTTTTTSTTTITVPASNATLTDTLATVQALATQDFSHLDPVKDKEEINQLIEILMQLIGALLLLLEQVGRG